jgi:hypothetical protein
MDPGACRSAIAVPRRGRERVQAVNVNGREVIVPVGSTLRGSARRGKAAGGGHGDARDYREPFAGRFAVTSANGKLAVMSSIARRWTSWTSILLGDEVVRW